MTTLSYKFGLLFLAFTAVFSCFSQNYRLDFKSEYCVNDTIIVEVSGNNIENGYLNSGIISNLDNPNFSGKLLSVNSSFNNPAHLKTVKNKEGNYFTFITNYSGSLLRYSHGANLNSTPTVFNFGNLSGLLTNGTTGIEVLEDNGNWFVFVTSNSNLVRLSYGSNLSSNTPAIENLASAGVFSFAVEINIFKYSNEWVGFVGNYTGSKQLTRLDFGNSLGNKPTFTHLSFPGTTMSDWELVYDKKNNEYFIFYSGQVKKTLTRVDFGSELKNANPTFTNLGNPNNLLTSVARGMVFFRNCTSNYLLVTDENSTCIKYEFPNGFKSNPIATSLGSLNGTLKKSSYCSRPFVYNDSMFFYIINVGSSEFIRYSFPISQNGIYSSLSSGMLKYKATMVGKLELNITINKGLYNQFDTCFETDVKACNELSIFLNNYHDTICNGDSIKLKVNSATIIQPRHFILWKDNIRIDSSKTGAFFLNKSGSYKVVAFDSTKNLKDSVIYKLIVISCPIRVTLNNSINSICLGDTLQLSPIVICKRQPIQYFWYKSNILVQSGFANIQIFEAGTYKFLVVAVQEKDSVIFQCSVRNCDSCGEIYIPNTFTPNNSGLNDNYIIKSDCPMSNYVMQIYDGWGEKIFQSNDPLIGWNGICNQKPAMEGLYIVKVAFIEKRNGKYYLKNYHQVISLLK